MSAWKVLLDKLASTDMKDLLQKAGLAGILLIVLIVAALILINRFRMVRRLKAAGKDPLVFKKLFSDKTPAWWLARSRLVARTTEKSGAPLPRMTGLDLLWIDRLARTGRGTDFRRVLAFAPDKGLFTAFIRALGHKKRERYLLNFLEKKGDTLILRKLALSGKGEDFNGRAALAMFANRMDRIREMTGDPEWAARYFAVKILLYDTDFEKSSRAIKESLEDPHPIVRKTIAREYRPATEEDKAQLLKTLSGMLVTDPVQEVRETVWARIEKDFRDIYTPDYGKLEGSAILHASDFLRSGHKEDEDFALRMLQGKDRELMQKAALYLQKGGVLEKMLKEADLGDQEDFKRTLRLLSSAVDVHVEDFLKVLESSVSPSTLIMGAGILAERGSRTRLHALAEKLLPQMGNSSEMNEAGEKLILALAQRGGEKGYRILASEMENRKRDGARLKVLFEAITPDGDYIYRPVLFRLLTDPETPEQDSLIRAFRHLAPGSVIPDILELLREGRDRHSHAVRIRALKVLGHYPASGCLRVILENLPILPVEEARDFAQVLSSHQKDLFIRHAEELLASVDAKVRAALISAVPATGNRDFLNQVKEGLKDADPDVRVASIIALIGYQETKYLPQTFDLLRDPIERVRETAARTISSFGASAGIQKMDEVLSDENEVLSVKKAILYGLSVSDTSEAIDILVEHLARDEEELEKDTATALARKRTPAQIRKIVEHFKNGDPALRDRLTRVFKEMGSEGEAAMVELLKEDIPSLREHITGILEKTGYVESTIRKLTHRSSEVRRDAATILSLIGTASAFRGIVLAARDPDSEVRVQVTKALERLNTKDGKALLDELTADPDLKVRRYTHWALERVKSKNL